MGLKDIIDNASPDKPDGVKGSKEKLYKPDLCPVCGQKGGETDHWYWRCNNRNCSVVTYIPTDER